MFKGESICYRCGFDFQLVLQCEEEGFKHYQKAIYYFKSNDYEKALRHIEKACFYVNDDMFKKMKILIILRMLYNDKKEKQKEK